MTNTTQNNPISADFPLSGMSLLPQWGLILIEGEDATSFLQNQLTNSILGLQATHPTQIAQSYNSVRLVGYCNVKGRLMASAWLALCPETIGSMNRYALFISKDIAASFAKRLSMFVLRSKVKINHVSDQCNVMGMYGSAQQVEKFSVRDDGVALMLPEVFNKGQLYSRLLVANPISDEASPLSESALCQWNSLEVLSAIPRIVLATQEQFVPQMINFESVGGVDFKKGCFPGQEIVARSQYRGSIKRRLQLAHLESEPNGFDISPGTELFYQDDPDQPAGMVVLSAVNAENPNWINFQIECKLEALEHGEIHLGSNQGPVLKIDPLPYPLLEI